MKRFLLLSILGVALLCSPSYSQNSNYTEALKSYEWRAIGPANMGGRVTDIIPMLVFFTNMPTKPKFGYRCFSDTRSFLTTTHGATPTITICLLAVL